jgi:V-type H+-transporting ATPase subunit G
MDISLDRVQRLKDARAEAAKEIEAYKQTKDAAFKSFEQSVRHSSFTHSSH